MSKIGLEQPNIIKRSTNAQHTPIFGTKALAHRSAPYGISRPSKCGPSWSTASVVADSINSPKNLEKWGLLTVARGERMVERERLE